MDSVAAEVNLVAALWQRFEGWTPASVSPGERISIELPKRSQQVSGAGSYTDISVQLIKKVFFFFSLFGVCHCFIFAVQKDFSVFLYLFICLFWIVCVIIRGAVYFYSNCASMHLLTQQVAGGSLQPPVKSTIAAQRSSCWVLQVDRMLWWRCSGPDMSPTIMFLRVID